MPNLNLDESGKPWGMSHIPTAGVPGSRIRDQKSLEMLWRDGVTRVLVEDDPAHDFCGQVGLAENVDCGSKKWGATPGFDCERPQREQLSKQLPRH